MKICKFYFLSLRRTKRISSHVWSDHKSNANNANKSHLLEPFATLAQARRKVFNHFRFLHSIRLTILSARDDLSLSCRFFCPLESSRPKCYTTV